MTDIYHITHIANLPSIVKDGGLWCDNERRHQRAIQVSIAYENLKERRRRTSVRVSAGGVFGRLRSFLLHKSFTYALHN